MTADMSSAGSHSILNWPLHPFLFAVASVLALMASSLSQVTPGHIVGALVGALIFALAMYAIAILISRQRDAQQALMATIWVTGSLFYIPLFGWFNDLVGGGFAMVRSLPFALATMALLAFAAARLPDVPARVASLVLNCIAAVMVATPALQAAAYEWQNGSGRAIYDPDRAAAELPTIDTSEAQGERPPDIYHFVFDRYSSPAVLAERYDYDDGATVAFLEERGFRVLGDAHANYHRTAHSLASTFYMDYLDLLGEAPDLAGDNWQAVHAMLGDHRVARFLKARGYRFMQFGSWWTGTFRNPLADINRPYGFSEFDMLYLRRTILRPIFHALPDRPLTMRLDWDNAQCQRVGPQIEEIKAIGEQDRPVYVFAHILVPHGPYNFTPEGDCLTMQETGRRGSQQGYVDQVAYAGRMIRDLVAHLQADRQNPPAIIIQSDEGPFPAREPGVEWQDQPDDVIRIKTGILSAYYFPDGSYDALDDQISPVNSYRILFNEIFDTDFERLPDRTYVFPDDEHLFDFHDVTDRVRRAN